MILPDKLDIVMFPLVPYRVISFSMSLAAPLGIV